VLCREAWESEIHAKKFEKILKKLKPEEASGKAVNEKKLPPEFADMLQKTVKHKYTQMLQRIRTAWVFQKDAMLGWQIMDFSMTKMKQLAHVSEEVAANGLKPDLKAAWPVVGASVAEALKNAVEDIRKSSLNYATLQSEKETAKHAGLAGNIALALKQEEYEADEIKEWAGRLISE
jgi:bacterioferritin